ncbi:hypothetical protein DL771_007984 [Monosporascus sp. 5C6A]|nr:hypothetical protein DL771_007984 [Monosporascus sp. 5C6A]
MALQFQFDVVNAVDVSRKLLIDLLKACAEEDIQPLIFQSLESFGQWLAVDKTRLDDGEEALADSDSKTQRFQNIDFGLSNRGVVKIVRENRYLTAAFIFIAGCSVMNARRTAKLMHEIMLLERRSQNSIASAGDFWTQATRQRLRIEDIYHDSEVTKLAELICEVFDAMQDDTNERVCLKGSRTGIWLATLFAWLRPKEVDIWVQETRIYPRADISGVGEAEDVRLSIIFDALFGHSTGSWRVEKWKRVQGRLMEDVITTVAMSDGSETPKPPNLPLNTAKKQIAAYGYSESTLEAIGHLAGALVILAVEMGELNYITPDRLTQPLSSLCSESFHYAYPTVMAWFGWQTLDAVTFQRICEFFAKIVESQSAEFNAAMSPLACLKQLIHAAAEDFEECFGSAMLLHKGEEDHERDIMEFAIHLSTEALFFSLCSERPRNAVYRPLEPRILHDNSAVLFSLAFGSPRSDVNGRIYKTGCTYWDFRNQAMQAIVNAGEEVRSYDLAINADGYVVYQTVLRNLEGTLTDRRTAATICVIPGSLKLRGVAGRYLKLVEQQESSLVTGRVVNT